MLVIQITCSELHSALLLRPPEDLKQVISLLQRKCGLRMPVCGSDYYDLPRTEIDVRRDVVASDGLRAAKIEEEIRSCKAIES